MLGLDNKQDKQIADRIDWITKCCVVILLMVKEKASKLGIELQFPDPPQS